MSGIDDARELIERRLADLNSERERLESALKELGGGKAPKRRGRPAGSASAAPSGRKKRRRRKGGPSRLDQAVAMIEASPGIGASEIAKKMKIQPNYLYRILGEAEKDGRVKKDGRAYHPVKAAAAQ